MPLTARLLSDRRGSRAWKLRGDGLDLALKANVPDAARARDKAVELEQENGNLVRLVNAGAIDSSYRIDAGPWKGGRWLAVRWVDGVPLWRSLALARGPEGDRPSVRPWLLGVARTWAQCLVDMHAAGWAHADVQPTNTLVDAGTVHIIDYALACGPGNDPQVPYRGALTHTTAPEIADTILSTADDTHIHARPPADIWGLGASLFWCWTGQRPVGYEDDTPRADKLHAIAQARTLRLAEARPWPFPAFEEAINACLAPEPDTRPTAAELVSALTTEAHP